MGRVSLFCLLLFVAGCQYYRVRDTASGKEYVTNNWSMSQSGFSGASRFTDMKTGKVVTLQSYEVEAISQQQAKDDISTGKN